jgi:DNA-directed RNA polymerase beta' subunit
MKRAAEFIDDITHLAIRAIMFDGFSFGIDDEDLSRTEYGQIDEVLNSAVLDVQRRIKIYEDGQLEPMPGRTLDETLEMQIMQVLWKLKKGFVRDVVDELPEPRPAYNTVSTIIRILEKKGFVSHGWNYSI